jgi:hypothetical protein
MQPIFIPMDTSGPPPTTLGACIVTYFLLVLILIFLKSTDLDFNKWRGRDIAEVVLAPLTISFQLIVFIIKSFQRGW